MVESSWARRPGQHPGDSKCGLGHTARARVMSAGSEDRFLGRGRHQDRHPDCTRSRAPPIRGSEPIRKHRVPSGGGIRALSSIIQESYNHLFRNLSEFQNISVYNAVARGQPPGWQQTEKENGSHPA
jgi:hypothetical protein